MFRWMLRPVGLIFDFFCYSLIFGWIDHSSSVPHCMVRLPYSMIPGMDISSLAYQKALSVIAKQHHDDHAFVSCVPEAVIPPSSLGMLLSSPCFISSYILLFSSLGWSNL